MAPLNNALSYNRPLRGGNLRGYEPSPQLHKRRDIDAVTEKVEIEASPRTEKGKKYYIIHKQSLSVTAANRIAGVAPQLRFEDIVFLQEDGTPCEDGIQIRIREIDLGHVDFSTQRIRNVVFDMCRFRLSNLGGSLLENVEFRFCTIQNDVNHWKVVSPRILLEDYMFQDIFMGWYEILSEEHPIYGPVSLVCSKYLFCGCRFFTFQQAADHWSKGSASGDQDFVDKVLETAQLFAKSPPSPDSRRVAMYVYSLDQLESVILNPFASSFEKHNALTAWRIIQSWDR